MLVWDQYVVEVKGFKLNQEESDCWAFVPGCNLLDRPIRHIKIMSVFNITSAQFSLWNSPNTIDSIWALKYTKMINCLTKMPLFLHGQKCKDFQKERGKCIAYLWREGAI